MQTLYHTQEFQEVSLYCTERGTGKLWLSANKQDLHSDYRVYTRNTGHEAGTHPE